MPGAQRNGGDGWVLQQRDSIRREGFFLMLRYSSFENLPSGVLSTGSDLPNTCIYICIYICILYVYYMYIICKVYVYYMYITCILYVYYMHIICILNVYYFYMTICQK